MRQGQNGPESRFFRTGQYRPTMHHRRWIIIVAAIMIGGWLVSAGLAALLSATLLPDGYWIVDPPVAESPPVPAVAPPPDCACPAQDEGIRRPPQAPGVTVKVENIEVLYEGFERNLLVTVRLRNGGTHAYQVDDHGSGASVLPYDPDRRVATLVLQKRAPMQLEGEAPALPEAPGGVVEADGPDASARREVLEEAGIRLSLLEKVGMFWSMPGISTERLHLYLAPYGAADRVTRGGGLEAEGEDIEVIEVPLRELAEMADRGDLHDLRTFTAVQALRMRQPALFAERL